MGQLSAEGQYTGNTRDGLWMIYKNNSKWSEGHYRNGIQVDTWQYFDQDGQLTHVMDYE
jgi:antitoxin component YwqK of YwqJK toxin-antitoxin module